MIKKIKKTYIFLDEIKELYKIKEHKELVGLIRKLIKENKIKPIKTSDLTAMHEQIYTKYRIIKHETEDDKEYIEEINYKTCDKLGIDYYRRNLKDYKKHRTAIMDLNDYFLRNSSNLQKRISINERSYEIFNDEKFITSREGKEVLKNLKIDIVKDLNVYNTPEPFIYLSVNRVSPQTILIIENKDTYVTVTKMLLEEKEVLKNKIDTVIYGEGRKIINSIRGIKDDITLEYMLNKENKFLYWGDIDRTGLSIYYSLKNSIEDLNINLFENAYHHMIEKASNRKIRLSVKNQKDKYKDALENIENIELREKIRRILLEGKYIPQESLNMYDLEE
ncbi:Wadjet anti-phage system protein JetD domain-containing protein [Asaccharospora irregularis]|uniref:Wadjet protein JetD C-terminal domain-containing protein n=1 Tax=Asaccharospora irregularis DSM 2635 TaxID=1121321 RepID=A0A1M5KXP7_9FIRM|nr:Wadjet anti-phage system protein JetD domain-containing protein [Asaccharospora irregularis]SHG57584.1 hypothetical protein SAMN04488530_103159 [Asaccharospora irregularis DSM 2635]